MKKFLQFIENLAPVLAIALLALIFLFILVECISTGNVLGIFLWNIAVAIILATGLTEFGNTKK